MLIHIRTLYVVKNRFEQCLVPVNCAFHHLVQDGVNFIVMALIVYGDVVIHQRNDISAKLFRSIDYGVLLNTDTIL